MNKGWFPLSFMQRIFWFLDQFEPSTPTYNLSRALKITGELDISALRDAFRALLRRHDVLRTGFSLLWRASCSNAFSTTSTST
jgi:hypothetical protein